MPCHYLYGVADGTSPLVQRVPLSWSFVELKARVPTP